MRNTHDIYQSTFYSRIMSDWMLRMDNGRWKLKLSITLINLLGRDMSNNGILNKIKFWEKLNEAK